LCGLAAAMMVPVQALVILGYDADRHDRFESGWSAAPVPNSSANFIGKDYDWSGVGWEKNAPNRIVAMISSQHFVYATHVTLLGTLSFYSPALGSVVDYTWSDVRTVLNDPWTGEASDFAIGELDEPLDPAHGIATYPIFDLGLDTDNYVGLSLFTYGRASGATRPCIGIDTAAGFRHWDLSENGTEDTYTIYHTYPNGNDSTYFTSGDSGGPLFVSHQGQLAILGTHSYVEEETGIWSSYDNFIPVYLDQMRDEDIPFTTVPEPEATAVVVLLAAAVTRLATRRRLKPTPRLH